MGRQASTSVEVLDVSGGMTLANAARAKLVAKDSVRFNQHLAQNPELAFFFFLLALVKVIAILFVSHRTEKRESTT